MKWEDVDWENKLLIIRRSLYRGVIDTTKSEKSTRLIPMAQPVMDALQSLSQSELNRGEFVFQGENGKPLHPDTILHRQFSKVEGVEPFTWRSFRRAGATELHGAGIPLQVQRDLMGHTQEETSLIYTDGRMKSRREAMETLMERILGVSKNDSLMWRNVVTLTPSSKKAVVN